MGQRKIPLPITTYDSFYASTLDLDEHVPEAGTVVNYYV